MRSHTSFFCLPFVLGFILIYFQASSGVVRIGHSISWLIGIFMFILVIVGLIRWYHSQVIGGKDHPKRPRMTQGHNVHKDQNKKTCFDSFLLSWLSFSYKQVKMLSVCMDGCLDVNQGETNHAETCNPAYTDLPVLVSPDRIPITRSV